MSRRFFTSLPPFVNQPICNSMLEFLKFSHGFRFLEATLSSYLIAPDASFLILLVN